jgi:hypothetical protein
MDNKEFNKLVEQRLNLADTADNDLILASANAQRQLWGNVRELLERMDLDANGNIRLTQPNIRLSNQIVTLMKEGLGLTDFGKAMELYLQKFDQSIEVNEKIAKQFKPTYTLNSAQKELMNQSKAVAIDLLTNEGYKSRIDQTFRPVLLGALQSGSSLRDTIRSLRDVTLGTSQRDGRLLANVKTYASTTFSTADRALANATYIDLGIEWYRYQGGEIDTTRPFCEERNGKYYHRSEIEGWAKKEWSGQIQGTNEQNIFVFAGGWNCRHSIVGVPKALVPKEDIERVKAKGVELVENTV